MNRKRALKKAIAKSQAEIEALEKKRIRSQSAILEAFMLHKEPTKEDKDYFHKFSSLIALERENLRELKNQLADLLR